MRFYLLALLVVAAFADRFDTPKYDSSVHTKVFKRWQKFFNKDYASIIQEAHRFTVFTSNWRYIETVNALNLSYTLGLNQFADLNSHEFRLYVNGKTGSCLRPGEKSVQQLKSHKRHKTTAPASVDWTTQGVVTPVKNQGQCGSCWAFSTTGSVESASAIKTGKLVSLSEQQLVDCARPYGPQGCNGGWMDDAFRYIQANGGLCSEQEYPYYGRDMTCRASSCGTKYDPIVGHTDVPADSTESLMEAIAKGPVSITIEADQQAFQFYRSGVMSGQCGTRLDHGVLAVGYGSSQGQDYWKVKNSWGSSWGEYGYIRMCKDCNKNGGAGECGLMEKASYPLA